MGAVTTSTTKHTDTASALVLRVVRDGAQRAVRRAIVAIARRGRTTRTIQVPLLFGDYVAAASRIRPTCSGEPNVEADSLWFHFTPQRTSCGAAIRAETQSLNDAARRLPSPRTQISRADADRLFVTVRADLVPVTAPPVRYPEYDRLWGFGSTRQLVVAYAFFGVDSDERDSHDVSFIGG